MNEQVTQLYVINYVSAYNSRIFLVGTVVKITKSIAMLSDIIVDLQRRGVSGYAPNMALFTYSIS